MKDLLTVNRADNGQYFIMNTSMAADGKPIGREGPFYPTMKAAIVAMFKMPKKYYTNIYDISEKAYSRLVSNR